MNKEITKKAWRIRIFTIAYFTALVTLVAPLTPLKNPPYTIFQKGRSG
jgi:hypothetical protein